MLLNKRNASTILSIVGGAGVVVTSILAVKATPKAMKLIEEAKEKKEEDLTKWETVKVSARVYVPSIIFGTVTVACIVGANILSTKREAAIMSAYGLLDQSYKQYQNKVKEMYGEDVHREILDAIAAERAENVGVNAPGFVSDNALYLDDKCGETRLFYDEYGDRFFESTLEQVISAEYHLNRNYVLRGYTVLNELYDFLGLEPTNYGDELGWAINDDGSFWIDFNHRKINVRGTDCIIIEMPFGPDLEWREYY